MGFDLRVYAAATLATLVTAVATGLVPALQIVRPQPRRPHSRGAQGATDGVERRRLRSLLIAAEVALALVLLVGAGLMGRTMLALERRATRDSASTTSPWQTVSLAGTPHAAPEPRRADLPSASANGSPRCQASTSVSAINHLPLAGDVWTLGYTIEGRPGTRARPSLGRGLPRRRPGLLLDDGYPDARRAATSRRPTAPARHPWRSSTSAMADRRWPGQNAVGQRLHLPGPGNVQDPITVVGSRGQRPAGRLDEHAGG